MSGTKKEAVITYSLRKGYQVMSFFKTLALICLNEMYSNCQGCKEKGMSRSLSR